MCLEQVDKQYFKSVGERAKPPINLLNGLLTCDVFLQTAKLRRQNKPETQTDRQKAGRQTDRRKKTGELSITSKNKKTRKSYRVERKKEI